MHLLPLLLICVLLPADDNIEWNGISHEENLDRRPLCPVAGESFEVRFQAYQTDLTAARVHYDNGSVQWIDAAPHSTRGPYQVWSAPMPATGAASLSYYIELIDGSDVDYLGPEGVSDGPPAQGWVLDFTTLSHAPVGATPVSGGGTVFKVWSPTTSSANVSGSFTGWGSGIAMQRVGDHFIQLVTPAGPGQQYKYVFEGSVWNSDPRARGLNPSDNLNSYVEDPFGYAWVVGDFATPAQDEMVVYQLHVGTYPGRNDPVGATTFPARYVDVAARTGHLAELGINVVMLNPVTEFAGDISAGYNPITQFAPEWKYGSPDEFKQMVDAFHQDGIAVILDIVWNHFSPTDNYLWYYDGNQIYYDVPAVDTPWGSQADFDEAHVREYFLDSAMQWLEEYHLDGFRMDATDYMNQGAHASSGWTLMQEFNDRVDQRFIDKVVIAEQLPDDVGVTTPTQSGGAGFDAQYYDEFTDRLREELLNAAYGDPQMWVIRNIVNGGGSYLNGRWIVNYLELHDEAWSENGGERFVKTMDPSYPHDDAYAKGRTKLGQGIVFLAPGIPAILQGTEWLEDIGWGPDYASRIDWSHKTTYSGIFAYYQDLIALRRTHPGLRAGASRQVFHLNESGNVIAWRRFDGNGEVVVCVASFSNDDYPSYRIGLPQSGTWQIVLHSQDLAYEGSGQDNPEYFDAEPVGYDGFSQSVALDLPAMSLVAIQKVADGTAAPEPRSRVGTSRVWFENSYPNPSVGRSELVYHLAQESRVEIVVYDLAGREVRSLVSSRREAGRHSVIWDGRDGSGREVASGVYLARISASGESATHRMVLVR